jgi:hypothetical protein
LRRRGRALKNDGSDIKSRYTPVLAMRAFYYWHNVTNQKKYSLLLLVYGLRLCRNKRRHITVGNWRHRLRQCSIYLDFYRKNGWL